MDSDYAIALAIIGIGFNMLFTSLDFLFDGTHRFIGLVALVGASFFGLIGFAMLFTLIHEISKN